MSRGGGVGFIFAKWAIPKFQEISPEIDMVSVFMRDIVGY